MEAKANLKNCKGSPRKMRLVADEIRGVDVEKALNILKFSNKGCAIYIEKLVDCAVSNWQTKNEGIRVEEAGLFIKEIYVDGGRMLKRIQPAPRGMAHRILKRSNHVTIVVDSLKEVGITTIEEEKTEKIK